MARTDQRTGFTDEQRIRLLEADIDELDAALQGMNDKLGKILWAVVGLLISVSTTCVVLLIQLGAA